MRAEPDQPLFRYLLGALLLQRGGDSLNETIALAREVVAGQANNSGYNMLRGDAAAELGLWRDAIEGHLTVIDRLPDSHLRLRVPMVLSGKADELAALYDGAVRAHPEMPLERLSTFRTLQAGALDRGVPAMALVTLPKPGNLYLLMLFVEGLNIPPCHIFLGLFPHDHLVPAWAEDLARWRDRPGAS